MALSLRFAARSDVGLLRDGNEDSGYAGSRLLVVADGMGGHAAGEVASSVAVATVAALDDDVPGPDLIDRLAGAVAHANEVLRDMVAGDPALEGMGTTLTAILRSGARLGVAHVGDSRGYLLRGGRLEQITHDHTFVQTLVDEGRITEEEADHHPQRNVIMRALDGRSDVELDVSVREARAGDRYLLCSDGLSGVVSRDTLEATMLRYDDPGETCDALVQLALRGGGPDNVTCIVADVVEVESGPPGAPQVVGAAAEPGTPNPDVSKGSGAAQRAAALNPRPPRRIEPDEDDTVSHEEHRRRWPLRILVIAVVTGLLVAGGWGAYAWSQRQFYVGADQDSVAIYKGISQDVLGVHLSEVYQRRSVTTRDLPGYSREQVASGIPADDLKDALAIVGRLEREAARCAAVVIPPATLTPSATPTPSLTPTPIATPPLGGGALTALPGTTAPPLPTTSALSTVAPSTPATPTPARVPAPRGCEGVEALADLDATASPSTGTGTSGPATSPTTPLPTSTAGARSSTPAAVPTSTGVPVPVPASSGGAP